MDDNLPHLRFDRLTPWNPRRTKPGRPQQKGRDAVAHATLLETLTDEAISKGTGLYGFDERLLFKLEMKGVEPLELEHFEGFEVVSQEPGSATVLFADEASLKEFKKRLGVVRSGAKATRADLLFAIDRIDIWSPVDRTGAALKRDGVPKADAFFLDVELWPLERSPARDSLLKAFEKWVEASGMEVADSMSRPSLILYRLRVSTTTLPLLLAHRDVRFVDLPPTYALDVNVFAIAVGDVPPPRTAPAGSAAIAILDTGVVRNHPFLRGAVGEAKSFVDGADAADEHGHGTSVAGLALFHDIHDRAARRDFGCDVRIFSGRVLEANGRAQPKLLEKQVESAVEYFSTNYGVKVFNLSVGDESKPYDNGHVRGLAVTLDEISRTRKVLFVVAVGNYRGREEPPRWRSDYPRYLLDRSSSRLLDPAPALNVLTVGGLARYEAPIQASGTDPAFQCVARTNQPSPFSRSGPGPRNAIKPDLVDYAGNYAVNVGSETAPLANSLGEVSLNHAFAAGDLLSEKVGTSFAAPKVSHLAAKVIGRYPDASLNLVRALLVGSAKVPKAALDLSLEPDELRRLVGYGRTTEVDACQSTQGRVTLMSEAELEENATHFFEIPLPEGFLSTGRRDRSITVALAHTPMVRTTRIDYRASKFDFRVVRALNHGAVAKVFSKTKQSDREEIIKEVRPPSVGWAARSKGTVQSASYSLKVLDDGLRAEKLFVVVSREVPRWASNRLPLEPYALVVTLEDQASAQAKMYNQVEVLVRQRVRQRT